MYQVRNVMSSPVVTIDGEATVEVALHLMRDHGISSVIVETPNNPPGIMTKRDIITKVVSQDKDPRQLQVVDIMNDYSRCSPIKFATRWVRIQALKRSPRQFSPASAKSIVNLPDSIYIAVVASTRLIRLSATC